MAPVVPPPAPLAHVARDNEQATDHRRNGRETQHEMKRSEPRLGRAERLGAVCIEKYANFEVVQQDDRNARH